MAGIPNKNEKRAASTLLKPRAIAVEIVIPDREIPGRIASNCANPIKTASAGRGIGNPPLSGAESISDKKDRTGDEEEGRGSRD